MVKRNISKTGDTGAGMMASQRCTSQEELTQRVREVAQKLYEKRGCRSGNELGDWLEAERIVKRTCSPVCK